MKTLETKERKLSLHCIFDVNLLTFSSTDKSETKMLGREDMG